MVLLHRRVVVIQAQLAVAAFITRGVAVLLHGWPHGHRAEQAAAIVQNQFHLRFAIQLRQQGFQRAICAGSVWIRGAMRDIGDLLTAGSPIGRECSVQRAVRARHLHLAHGSHQLRYRVRLGDVLRKPEASARRRSSARASAVTATAGKVAASTPMSSRKVRTSP